MSVFDDRAPVLFGEQGRYVQQPALPCVQEAVARDLKVGLVSREDRLAGASPLAPPDIRAP